MKASPFGDSEDEAFQEEEGKEGDFFIYFLSLGSMTLKGGTERLSPNVAKWPQNHAA
jgi:hypothetical protein